MGNVSKIVNYFSNGESSCKKLGIELEHFVCDTDENMIKYKDLSKIMEAACTQFGWKPICEEENIIGADCEQYYISLEPAGQLEVSIPPYEKIEDIEKVYKKFRENWDHIFHSQGYHLKECGVFPLVENGEMDPRELNLIPKKRYHYMASYFEKTGKYGHYMMRATASTQVSIDYSTMEDCRRKLQILEKISPFLALLMENQCGVGVRKEWRPHLLRNQIWKSVDNARCGYIPNSLKQDFSYADYAEYIYHNAAIVLPEGEKTVNVGASSAAEYLQDKEMNFVEHLATMFFFHVRLKNYIEVRVADSVPMKKMLGYAALIKGLMYSESGLKKLEDLCKNIRTIQDIEYIEDKIEEQGYCANVHGKMAVEWLCEIYSIAMNELETSERMYLKDVLSLPLVEFLYCKNINKELPLHSHSAKVQKEYILNSTAKYHERVVRTMYVPKMYTKAEVNEFERVVDTTYQIFDKIILEYEKNEEYRRLFGFDKCLEELILTVHKYKRNVPMARLDLFYNEQNKSFKFCEFNTDGSSGMNEDRELNTALKLTKAYEDFARDYEVLTYELFDSWIDEVLAIYEEYSAGREKNAVPNVAIIDFLEHGTLNEFEIFRKKFEARGMNCEICDIRKLRWDGTHCLTPSGMKVDLVYRRAVTTDILAHFDEVSDFIAAYKKDAFCLLGDFRTQIIHNKILYKILHLPETKAILSESENRFVAEHVPYTVSLTSGLLEINKELRNSVFSEKDNWIIKPEDSYGSKGLHAGVECDDKEWEIYVKECMDSHYILQAFHKPYHLMNIDCATDETGEWKSTSNLTGLFVYNGKLRGLYSRISYDDIISTQYNEMTLPTIVVDIG